jgi:hypothetical protein
MYAELGQFKLAMFGTLAPGKKRSLKELERGSIFVKMVSKVWSGKWQRSTSICELQVWSALGLLKLGCFVLAVSGLGFELSDSWGKCR